MLSGGGVLHPADHYYGWTDCSAADVGGQSSDGGRGRFGEDIENVLSNYPQLSSIILNYHFHSG